MTKTRSAPGSPAGPDGRPAAGPPVPIPPRDSAHGPPDKYWQDYFSKNRPASTAIADAVLKLHAEKRYVEAVAVIEAALLNGQVQPWMYDVLALSLQLAGRPKADVERALLSRVDYLATDVPSTLLSAAYLARFGAKEQALRLYRQASEIEPTRPESYVLGLRLAREIKDFPAVQWAATGVLRTAWSKDYEHLHRDAEDAALEAERSLRAAGRQSQADALRDAMAQARVRDLVVRLRWSGDADLDLIVEEPLGTVASCQDSQSRGGGVHMHDGYGPDAENCFEQYVCAEGAPGVYVIRVRRVAGRAVGNRAQLTVTRNQGAPNETAQTFVLKLEGGSAAVRVELPAGRRKALAPARAPADAKTGLLERLLPLLAGEPRGRTVPFSALPAVRAAQGPGGNAVPFVGGAAATAGPGLSVGYQPIIELLPEGVTLEAAAVVSHDLRYVRLAVNPNFTSITDVFQFTFVNGGR